MIILAIGKPLLSLNNTAFTIACLLLFIITMHHTLKHGEPEVKTTVVSNHFNDDFDDFMRQETVTPSTSYDSSYGDADTYTEPFGNNSDTNSAKPQKSSSGLSLKKED